MKRIPSLILFFGLVVVVAACAAGVCAWVCSQSQRPAPMMSAHDLIHTQLGLTDEQTAALEPIEESYAERRGGLERALDEANGALADAIVADGRDSEGVHRAIEEIHSRMGDLQKETIGHVFAMRAVLTPDQYDQLIALTAEALRGADTDTGEHAHSH